MTVAIKNIEEYVVMYSANAFSPRIWLKANGAYFGQLVFRPNGSSLPSDSEGSLFYHLEEFQHCLDLLRNEKPVYYQFVGTGGGNENGIRTSVEEVGEAEAYPT
jgi:hypothetical protein